MDFINAPLSMDVDQSRSACCFNSDFGNENVSPCDLGNDFFDDMPPPTATPVKMNDVYRGVDGNNPENDDGLDELVHDIYSGGLGRHTMLQSRSNDDRAVTPIHAYQYAAEAATGAEEFFAAGGKGVGTTPGKGNSAGDTSTPLLRALSHYGNHDSAEEMELYDCPITVDHVHWLMKSSNINEDIPITSLKQCSPSFFVLLFQRLLPNQNIKDIEMEPNTQEKRHHNIQRVLERLLDQNGTDEPYISATEIVNLNEEHISRLIRVFLMLALRKIKLSELHAYDILTHTPQQQLRNLVNTDSAVSTEQLISNWKKEIVPPTRAPLSHLSYSNQLAYHPNNYHPDHDHANIPAFRGSKQRTDYTKGSDPVATAKLNVRQEIDSVKHRIIHIDNLLETPPEKENTAVYSGSQPRHQNFLLGKDAIAGDRAGDRDMYTDPYYRPSTLPFGCISKRPVPEAVPSGRPSGAQRVYSYNADNGMPTSGRKESHRKMNDISVKLRRKDHSPRTDQQLTGGGRSRPSSGKRKDRRTASSFSAGGSRLLIPSTTFPSETYNMVKCIDTEARDLKIEQLRTMRFIKDTQMTMRADLVRQASQRNAQIAAETKKIAKMRQRDIRDLQKLVRDEEGRYLQGYGCVLMSARNEIEKNQLLVDPRTVQLHRRNMGLENEAMVVLKEYEQTQEAMIDSKVHRYRTVLCRWRHGTIAY